MGETSWVIFFVSFPLERERGKAEHAGWVKKESFSCATNLSIG